MVQSHMKRTLIGLSLSAVACVAMATPAFLGVFLSNYKVKGTSDLGKAKCAICHTKGKQLDAYGEDLKKALGGAKKLTPEILAKVESLDSDKDGVKNGDEIKKGTLPGDPKSK
ncbi:MAG TPA: hypothetical protein DER07_06910 [Armatimonadetes bacterium]|nr:hypothetical protein [Armatimonadota bacterium]